MEKITTIGLDLSKSVFQIHAIADDGSVMTRRVQTPCGRTWEMGIIAATGMTSIAKLILVLRDNEYNRLQMRLGRRSLWRIRSRRYQHVSNN